MSIIISGVLLPLAVGYHVGGGAYKRSCAKRKTAAVRSVRELLLSNILSALIILALGLSYVFLELFFGALHAVGITHRIAQTAVYALLFLVTPVFLLGQTVPLVSNYFSQRSLSEITGKMLFFSTAGSFLGSVFSTIVLMNLIGVHNTVIVTLGLLCILCVLLAGRKNIYQMVLCVFLFSVIFILNSKSIMSSFHIVSNNVYNTISVVEDSKNEAAYMFINRSNSSKWSKDPDKRFEYVKYIENTFITPINKPGNPPKEILIIGAGGFIMGLEDEGNHYTFVDIDPALKHVAERYLLPKKLSPNKEFIASSARAFVHNNQQAYDLIILDTFTNVVSIPMECTTREYLQDVKKLLKKDGILVANIISNPNFGDIFTVRYDNTFSSVFPKHDRQLIGEYNPWNADNTDVNALYIYHNSSLLYDEGIYTDDKNTYSLDRN